MTKQQKKAEIKNQHYVPQFYLKYFSDVKKKIIGVYTIKDQKKIDKAPIKNQSSSDYFYSDNNKIENALSVIEKTGKEVIDEVIKNPREKLKKKGMMLYIYTMVQLLRTLAQVNSNQELLSCVLSKIGKKNFEILRNSENGDEYKEITDELIEGVSFKINQLVLLGLSNWRDLINVCADLKFKILINETEKTFITSDNPVSQYSQFLERMGAQNYALCSRGLQLFFPLTPLIGVMFYDPQCYKLGDRKKNYVELKEKDIEELNKLTALYAEKVLYFSPESITDSDLKSLSENNKQFKQSEQFGENADIPVHNGVIIGFHSISLFCKLNLSFIKELDKYRSLRKEDFDEEKYLYRMCLERRLNSVNGNLSIPPRFI